MSKSSYELYTTEHTEESGKLHILQQVIIELLLTTGILGLMFCFLSDGTGRLVLTGVAVLVLVYLRVISDKKPEQELLRMGPVAVGILALLVTPISASRGFLFFCNQCISLWDKRFDFLVPQLQVSEASVWGRLQIFLFFLCIFCVWIHNQVQEKHLVRISVMAVLVLLLTAVFQMNYSIVAVLAVIIGWILAWVTQTAVNLWSAKSIPIILGCVAAALLVGILYMGYSGDASVEGIKTSFCKQYDKFRYGEDTLPNGSMTDAVDMIGSKDQEALKITTDSPREMYLKGFVGGIFDGSSWSVLKYRDYTDEEISMIQWLQDQSFETSFQYSNYMTYTGDGSNTPDSDVTIENVGADRKYVYLPYKIESLTTGSGAMNRDYQLKSAGIFGQNTYSFKLYDIDQPTEAIVQKQYDTTIAGTESYAQMESVYQTFVNENYMDLTDEQKTELTDIFFADGDWSSAGLYQVTEQIRKVFQEKTTYTDQPKAYPGNVDFVSWFIDTAQGGNSAYYATAATLAYRAAGIPARYAEGYYLSKTDAAAYEAENQTNITLTQANVHAWTEIYLDRVGWMPVEIIPGFYYAEYTTQQLVGAPQSTVNVTNQTDQQELQGSTTDSIESSGDTQKKDDEPVVQKVLRIAGILLLIALIVWLLQFLVLARSRILRWMFDRKVQRANHEDASRMHYGHVCKVLKTAGVPVREDFPYENIPLILEKYPQMGEFECKRFAQLLQKVVFGQQELNDAEYQTVVAYDEKLTDEVYQGMNRKEQLKARYGGGLV